jgi:hypothetical protein
VLSILNIAHQRQTLEARRMMDQAVTRKGCEIDVVDSAQCREMGAA